MKECELSWESSSRTSVSLANEVWGRDKLRKVAGVGQVFGLYITEDFREVIGWQR